MPENEFYWRKNHLPIFQTHVSACCSALATLQRYRLLRSFEKGTTGTLGGVPMSHGIFDALLVVDVVHPFRVETRFLFRDLLAW
jgi:hypothetical protein